MLVPSNSPEIWLFVTDSIMLCEMDVSTKITLCLLPHDMFGYIAILVMHVSVSIYVFAFVFGYFLHNGVCVC